MPASRGADRRQQQLGTRVASADTNELTVSDGIAWNEAAFGAPNPLPLTMQMQQMSNWCLAATSSSINDFYFGGNLAWSAIQSAIDAKRRRCAGRGAGIQP